MVAQIDKQYWSLGPKRILVRLTSYIFFEGRPITTKGRFINKFLIALYKLLSASPFYEYNETPVCYIVGSGRSGTTYLGKVLSAHSKIGFLNEPKLIWSLVNENDDLVGSYQSIGSGRYEITKLDIVWLRKFYNFYGMLTRSSMVVDKYPEMIFRYHEIVKQIANAKFIYLSRSPRVLAHSIRAWNTRHGQIDENWWGLNECKWKQICCELVPQSPLLNEFTSKICCLERDEDRAIVEAILVTEQANSLKSLNRDNFFYLEYEHLVEDPQIAIQKICNFLEIDAEDYMLDYLGRTLTPSTTQKFGDMPLWLENVLDQIDIASS